MALVSSTTPVIKDRRWTMEAYTLWLPSELQTREMVEHARLRNAARHPRMTTPSQLASALHCQAHPVAEPLTNPPARPRALYHRYHHPSRVRLTAQQRDVPSLASDAPRP